MERIAQNCVSLLAQRRGYSVAATVAKGAARSRAEENMVAKRVLGKKDVNTAAAATAGEEKTAWVPDPVTGYYRPAGGAKEVVDAAEMRAKVLAHAAD